MSVYTKQSLVLSVPLLVLTQSSHCLLSVDPFLNPVMLRCTVHTWAVLSLTSSIYEVLDYALVTLSFLLCTTIFAAVYYYSLLVSTGHRGASIHLSAQLETVSAL